MAREYLEWERCDLNMSGIHTWTLKKNEGRYTGDEKKGPRVEIVACNRCGKEPPTVHRTRIGDLLRDARIQQREELARRKILRDAMRGVKRA
jgi:hypothetical protein